MALPNQRKNLLKKLNYTKVHIGNTFDVEAYLCSFLHVGFANYPVNMTWNPSEALELAMCGEGKYEQVQLANKTV